MNKYTNTLRWLSLIPVTFTTFILSDWAVRLLFWFIRLPIIIFSPGPFERIMDSVTNYLIGLDSDETIIIIITSLVTGYAAVYIPAIVVPTNNKKTAKTLATIYLVLLALGLVSLMITGISGENILWTIFLTIGILSAWRSAKNETGQEAAKYEDFVQKHITTIFVLTLLFTILMAGCFLIV